jgi:hypothetical protein
VPDLRADFVVHDQVQAIRPRSGRKMRRVLDVRRAREEAHAPRLQAQLRQEHEQRRLVPRAGRAHRHPRAVAQPQQLRRAEVGGTRLDGGRIVRVASKLR